MGLARPALRFIACQHHRTPLPGPVLTLGRQDVFATLDEMRGLLLEEGITPAPLDASLIRDHVTAAGAADDVVFFKLLGLDVVALDVSDYEGVDLIADLNREIPSDLRGRFGTVIDSGTLEHVFNVRQALANVCNLLPAGGRAIHISPVNNWANHGFYQFSPTLFYDFYRVNGWADVSGVLFEQDLDDYNTKPWRFYDIDFAHQPGRLVSHHGLLGGFVARKTEASTADEIPTQSLYISMHAAVMNADGTATLPPVGLAHRLGRRLPGAWKLPVKRLLRLDPERKPWGMRRIR